MRGIALLLQLFNILVSIVIYDGIKKNLKGKHWSDLNSLNSHISASLNKQPSVLQDLLPHHNKYNSF